MKSSQLPAPLQGKSGWPWLEAAATPVAMDLRQPRITVVTPSFNQAQFLEETIRSVLLQGYPNLEYIVIDGGSTDGSVEIIQRYQDHLAFWISETDRGQAHAINKGFQRATGDWVGWLNSDDFFLPNSLASLMTGAQRTGCRWVAGSVCFIHENGIQPASVRRQNSSDKLVDWLVSRFHFHQPGTLWRRDLFDQRGFLDESMHYAFDWAFWCRLVASGVTPCLVEEVVATFRMHEESKTCTRWDGFCGELEQLIKFYTPDLNRREKFIAGRRRTNLVCTRLRHESYRMFAAHRERELMRGILQSITHRPQLLLKRTPYRLVMEYLFPNLRQFAPSPD